MSVPQILSTVACLIALAWPGLSAASYRIQLRNGRHVATSQYWKEGQTIKFYTAGGVGGVPEGAVLRIQTVEDPPESNLVGAAEQQGTPQTERQAAGRLSRQPDQEHLRLQHRRRRRYRPGSLVGERLDPAVGRRQAGECQEYRQYTGYR